MKNKTLIYWLVAFFPIGLFYIFTKSNWSKRVKYGLIAFYSFITALFFATGNLYDLIFLTGITLFLGSVARLFIDLYRHNNKKSSLANIGMATILLLGASLNMDTSTAEKDTLGTFEEVVEAEVIEEENSEEDEELNKYLEVLGAVEEAISNAEESLTIEDLENAQDLLASIPEEKEEYLDLIARLDKIELQILELERIDFAYEQIEKAEENPTRKRYESALKSIEDLEDSIEELEHRLSEVLEMVEEIEEAIKLVSEVLDTAEASPTWENHESARLSIAALPSQTSTNRLIKRLDSVENEIISIEKAEEKRLAEEAEKARQAEIEAQKAKEEAEKKAQEETEKKAAEEAERARQAELAAQQAAQESNAAASQSETGEAALLNFLNTATKAELQSVSYIGDKRSTYIIEYRERNGAFTHSSQVKNVNQIGDGIYNNLREKFNMN